VAARADVILRDAEPRDLPAITAIYGHHVRTGLASFETEAPDTAEMQGRYEAIREKGFPYLVAEEDGAVVGYAYASLYRTRPAYRFTLEDSVYVKPGCAGRGLGRMLLERLIAECERIGCRQLIAVIGDSGNVASVRLHEACGFGMTGTFRSIGFKHGRWVDTVLMQRTIGPGDSTPPQGEAGREAR
jgi:L-amino acid N-acyltransferase YncA